MSDFRINFKYQPVGQGLFYTGLFEHANSGRQFSLAYDCGVLPNNTYIQDCINNFAQQLHEHEKLDVLIISHFHDDHINNISDLLQQTRGSKKVFLPYLSPDEMLIAFIEHKQRGGDPGLDEFFVDPRQFLFKREVKNIIFIHPNEGLDKTENQVIDDIKPDPDNFEFDLRIELLENTGQPETNPRVKHYFDIGSVLLNKLWQFKFFNKVRNQAQVSGFITDIQNLIPNENDLIKEVAVYK